MRRFALAVRVWVVIAVAVSALTMLAYVVGQQVYRSSANDPQVQMAEDAARRLKSGEAPASVTGTGTVDLSGGGWEDPQPSLAPFLNVYDAKGAAIAGTGRMGNGIIAVPPIGVLQHAAQVGTYRVTWEPGGRYAAVVVPVGDGKLGFVLAGRSLRETERRIDDLGKISLAAWAATLFATLVAALLFLGEPARS